MGREARIPARQGPRESTEQVEFRGEPSSDLKSDGRPAENGRPFSCGERFETSKVSLLKQVFRSALVILGILVVCLPVSFVVTFILYPFWSWIESRFAIESVGHSGPADWCFAAVYVLLSAVSVFVAFLLRRSTRNRKRV